MSYNRRLDVVNANNLAEYQAAFPSAKVGDVDQIDGNNRDDLYVLNGSSYISPAGYYSQLTKNPDGTYTERFGDGTVYNYSRPDSQGVATLKSESDAERRHDAVRLQRPGAAHHRLRHAGPAHPVFLQHQRRADPGAGLPRPHGHVHLRRQRQPEQRHHARP